MEDFGALAPPPIDVCRQKVLQCDAMLLLIAHRYGSRPDGYAECYTELEYDWAYDAKIPVFAYVVDADTPWPPKELERSEDDSRALKSFVAKVSGRHTIARFGDITEFPADLSIVLARERDHLREPDAENGGLPRSRPGVTAPALAAFPSYSGAPDFIGRVTELRNLDEWCQGNAGPVRILEAIGGTGKSALAWSWLTQSGAATASSWVGRFWWSFYEGSSSVQHFLAEFVAYARPDLLNEGMTPAEMAGLFEQEARDKPYLLVLDGLERLTLAYQTLDPSKITDEDVEHDSRARPNAVSDAATYDLLTRLPHAVQSRILIPTRLTPDALLDVSGRLRPGVSRQTLGGLGPDDTIRLVTKLGVHGTEGAITVFFGKLDFHPLLIAVIAGLVNNYRAAPGDFDAWLADPAQGGSFRLSELGHAHRRAHIVTAALKDLDQDSAKLLRYLSTLPTAVDWSLVQDINPFTPTKPRRTPTDLASLGPRPRARWAPDGPLREAARQDLDRWEQAATGLASAAEEDYRTRLAAWEALHESRLAVSRLERALQDLEDRGLLWWDRIANTYDMHPVIRSSASEGIHAEGRLDVSHRVADHFATWHAPRQARSVDDLTPAITTFRVLASSGNLDAAFAALRPALNPLQDLGASSTLIGLLEPFAARCPTDVRFYLVEAHSRHGDVHRSVEFNEELLISGLRQRSATQVGIALSNIELSLKNMRRFADAQRVLGFLEMLLSATVEVTTDSARLAHKRAENAIRRGRYAEAAELLAELKRLPANPYNRHYAENILELELRLKLGLQTLENHDIDHVGLPSPSFYFRCDALDQRFLLAQRRRDFATALTAATDLVRLRLESGEPASTARVAWSLAMLGRPEAPEVLDSAIAAEARLQPWDREPDYIADALLASGRESEAIPFALQAYEMAWADGPDFQDPMEMSPAIERLSRIGKPAPNLEPRELHEFAWETDFHEFLAAFTDFDLGFLSRSDAPLDRRQVAELWETLAATPSGGGQAIESWCRRVTRCIAGDTDPSVAEESYRKLYALLELRVGQVLTARIDGPEIRRFELLQELDYETVELLIAEAKSEARWESSITGALAKPPEEVAEAVRKSLSLFWLTKQRENHQAVVASVMHNLAAAIRATFLPPGYVPSENSPVEPPVPGQRKPEPADEARHFVPKIIRKMFGLN